MGEWPLTNREVAAVVAFLVFWLGVGAVAFRTGSHRSILLKLWPAAVLIWKSKFLLLCLIYFGIIAVAIWGGARSGIWNSTLLKGTILWCFFWGARLFGKLWSAAKEKGVFLDALKQLLVTVIVVEFVVNLVSFPLWVEIPAALIGTLCSVLSGFADGSGQRSRGGSIAKFCLFSYGTAAITWSVWRTQVNWSEIDKRSFVLEFVLPLWLTLVALVLLYPLALVAAFEFVNKRMDWGANGDSTRAQRAAVVLRCAGRLGKVRELRGSGHRIGRTEGFRAAWTEVGAIHEEQRDRRREEAAAKKRLKRNAGLVGVDPSGKQLDQREHAETRESLNWLATCQMGRYRNRGRYDADVQLIADGLSEKYKIPHPTGIRVNVSSDGQRWFAERQTITGHWFAIGAAGPAPDQWFYDGPTAPTDFPNEAEWAQWAPDDNAPNWD